MNQFLDHIFWGNSVQRWLVALAIFLIGLIAARVLKNLGIKRLTQLAKSTSSTFDDLLVTVAKKVLVPLLYLCALYLALRSLDLHPKVDKAISASWTIILTFMVLRLITSLLSFSFHRHISDESREKQARGILIIFDILLWMIGFVFVIDNLGYNITTIITGLGVGGIAIALAAQTVLADLFSYLVIFFDKPFEIGDFIITEKGMGSIEYIGIKTTRIRTLDGEQLIASNSALTGSWVHNYKRMVTRRIVFSFSLDRANPSDKIRKVPGIIKSIIETQKPVKFDRAHFLKFGEYSFDFEVVYIVLDADYNKYMDIQQAINLAMLDRFENEGIELAFPSRELFIHKEDAVSSSHE
ncbi:MAG: mechanosensitive ion channel family protein [Bacteroidetes bacterium]|nr:mechanosensitive ion channel family protein [Bacteroidota bacterium]